MGGKMDTETKYFQSKVVKNRLLNKKFRRIGLRFLEEFSCEAGQFVVVRVSENIVRAYSIATHPRQLPYWEIILDITPGGPGCKHLSGLRKGEIVETTKASGVLTLKDDGSSCFLGVATGCGIASIKPLAEEAIEKGYKRVEILWGLRNEKELFWKKELNDLLNDNSRFGWSVAISRPNKGYGGKKGRVTDHLREKLGRNTRKTSVYLCGNREMVEDVSKILSACDISKGKRLYFERYY
jgi:NAD(P)H-flavin reductase